MVDVAVTISAKAAGRDNGHVGESTNGGDTDGIKKGAANGGTWPLPKAAGAGGELKVGRHTGSAESGKDKYVFVPFESDAKDPATSRAEAAEADTPMRMDGTD